MARTRLSPDDLKEALGRQIRFLLWSAESFDKDIPSNQEEAIRMATTLRVLFHDRQQSNSRSLLDQLEAAGLVDISQLRFNDTSFDYPPFDVPEGATIVAQSIECGLVARVQLQSGDTAWSPGLDAPGHHFTASFTDWWTKPILSGVFTNRKPFVQTSFSRSQLVRVMADQDGGAHVDPSLDSAYHGLFRGVGSPTYRAGGTGPGTLGNPALTCVRQITHEVLTTIQDQIAGLLPFTLHLPELLPYGPVIALPSIAILGFTD